MNEKIKKVIEALSEQDRHMIMWALWMKMSPEWDRILVILKKMPIEEVSSMLSYDAQEEIQEENNEATMMPPHIEKMKMLFGKISPEHKDYLMK